MVVVLPLSKKRKDMYIAIEGIDGSGKSTLCNVVKEYLYSYYKKSVFVTHDPDDNFPLGDYVRKMWRRNEDVGMKTYALLFAASSVGYQISTKGIKDLLNDNNIILSDRCAMSNYTYFLNYCDINWIHQIHNSYKYPDLTIVLDISLEILQDRIRQRGEKVPSLTKLENCEIII